MPYSVERPHDSSVHAPGTGEKPAEAGDKWRSLFYNLT
jgi:hypothetical protein